MSLPTAFAKEQNSNTGFKRLINMFELDLRGFYSASVSLFDEKNSRFRNLPGKVFAVSQFAW